MLGAAPQKSHRAFLEPEVLAKWILPDGFTSIVQHLDPRVSGTFPDGRCMANDVQRAPTR